MSEPIPLPPIEITQVFDRLNRLYGLLHDLALHPDPDSDATLARIKSYKLVADGHYPGMLRARIGHERCPLLEQHEANALVDHVGAAIELGRELNEWAHSIYTDKPFTKAHAIRSLETRRMLVQVVMEKLNTTTEKMGYSTTAVANGSATTEKIDSDALSPRDWGHVFEMNGKTFVRWFEKGTIVAQKLTDKSYRISLARLGPGERKRYDEIVLKPKKRT